MDSYSLPTLPFIARYDTRDATKSSSAPHSKKRNTSSGNSLYIFCLGLLTFCPFFHLDVQRKVESFVIFDALQVRSIPRLWHDVSVIHLSVCQGCIVANR